jgi:hypothetical protein
MISFEPGSFSRKGNSNNYNSLTILLLFLVLLVGIGFSGCKHKRETNNAPLARVGDNYLYVNDLKGITPKDISSRDSLLFCQSYINKWVHTQLLLQQAEKNLSEEKLNFKKRLEEYRNSLIIYQYETEYVRQNMDTIVTEQQIDNYYNSHLKDFQLKENIVKVIYAILDRNREDIPHLEKTFWQMFHLPDSVLLDSLENYAPVMAESFSVDTNSWIPFNQLLKVIPIETYNQGIYLKNHRIIRLKDDSKIYLVKFVNFKIKDDISPEELEANFIRQIILNRRKTKMINRLREDIFKHAINHKEFEIY